MGPSLPEPVGAQRDVVYLKTKGHVVVLGTAGSGKTSMAILRALWLADHAPEIAGNTLLVTFNKALVTFLRKTVGTGSSNLVVENYHKFAAGYLAHRGLMGWRDTADNERAYLIEESIQAVKATDPKRSIWARPRRFFEDEFHWLAGNGVTSEQAYIEAERIGRGLPLQPNDRRAVFAVREQYLQRRLAIGRRYDWDDMAMAVRTAFLNDQEARKYRHVVIDEGQDFSPEMVRSLAAATGPNGSLTFFGDYAQQMYGSRLSWRSLGLNVRQVVLFEQNYRNSPQISKVAIALSNMPFFRDEVDLVEPKNAAADGPRPVLIQLIDRKMQFEQAIGLAARLGRTMTVGLLFRKRDVDGRVAQALPNSVRLHKRLSTWPLGPHVFYGTYHAAKGLEFDAVILPFCDDDVVPDPDEVAAHGVDEATSREARLLYVAITRAKSRLYIMHGRKPTRLLPPSDGLFEIAGR